MLVTCMLVSHACINCKVMQGSLCSADTGNHLSCAQTSSTLHCLMWANICICHPHVSIPARPESCLEICITIFNSSQSLFSTYFTDNQMIMAYFECICSSRCTLLQYNRNEWKLATEHIELAKKASTDIEIGLVLESSHFYYIQANNNSFETQCLVVQ